ncbi:hydroxymethylglutaryl-CoA reductase (NADPH) [Methanogenium organophilum]|uniref:3-hydroxy-3-methylglutaryl coenzyme A reductase n=1 Tax=Methanogenium organophilum TaxID=2199 RepID=A0A9X9T6I2_METOG|nr:hydroxymethylglutaryl-CoA reductase (NADPH) [Methanogenium organophilum]WAI00413.1 hydroxymethylglutaryl-CoA reductase (NADPH) [Methanogenium organophilum]
MDDYMQRIRDGSLKLYALEAELPPDEAISVRRSFIEEETGVSLDILGEYAITTERVTKRNCENMIGAVQVPVGVAGPLRVMGEYADGTYYLPLATTEGALIASVNRGCSAITKAGGAEVRIQRDGMTRAPVFACDSVPHAIEAARWVEEHFSLLADAAAATTSHGRMERITTHIAGTSLYVRFEFFTGDAMGMNMVTIGSEKAAEIIQRETGARLIALSGNLCTDKKPSAANVVMGRGKTVAAGIFLSDAMVKDILKTDAASLAEVNTRKNLVGSARAVSLGFNAHAANVIAAVFLACGQDPAHVVEGSNAITTVDPVEGGVYVAVTLPSLQVGTVGGGSAIETQQTCLQMLGVAGGGEPAGSNAKAFAEIIAAGVLAGELSLLGALAAGHLARAHKKLGRG